MLFSKGANTEMQGMLLSLSSQQLLAWQASQAARCALSSAQVQLTHARTWCKTKIYDVTGSLLLKAMHPLFYGYAEGKSFYRELLHEYDRV